MITQHKELARERWNRLSFFEQMANIGSEVERTIKWREKKIEYSQAAFDRALELIDLTILDQRNTHRLKEIVRVREVLCDYFIFQNEYQSNDAQWQKYFYAFAFAARNI